MKEASIHFKKGIEAEVHGFLKESAQHYAQGHELGDNECSAMLALCYVAGSGVPRAFCEFYRIAQELAETGSPLAHCLLASAYSDGHGCRSDYEKAVSHLKQWAEISASPMPEISEDCRLHMRAYGLSDSLESYMEREHSNSDTSPWIDINQTIREYAQKTTLADKITAEMTTLIQEDNKKQELMDLMERACNEGIADSEALKGNYMLRTCDEDDEVTWNKGIELIRHTSETSPVDILLLRLRVEDNEEERKKLIGQVTNNLRYGLSGIARADELPVRVDVSRNNWSCVYYVHDIDESIALVEQQQADRLYRPMSMPIIHITNTDCSPLKKPTLRIVQEGMGGEQAIESDKDLMPGERYSIDLNEYIADYGNNFRLELSVEDGRYTTFFLPTTFLDFASTQPPHVELYHNSNSLIILPRNHHIEKLELLTPSGEKIAELCNLKQDESVTVDIWHIKSLMLKERTDAFILICPEADPAVCFLK